MDHQQAVSTHAAERYLLNELDGADRDAFEEHYFTCVECAEDIRAGGLMRDGARAGMTAAADRSSSAQVVSIASRRKWHTSVVLPWAAAATWALVAGYQALWVVPGLQDQGSLAAVSPVLLRPASRGAIPTVPASSAGVIALALDLNSANPASSLSYDLRAVDGKTVASGVVAAPPAGSPLLLVVPVARLTASGTYLLQIRESGVTNAPVIEFQFAVAR